MRRILAVIILSASALFSQISNPNTQIYSEAPAGTTDGVNASFTLNYVPAIPNSLSLFRNGIRQKVGVDFTLTGNTIAFVSNSIPQPGDVLIADYVTGNTASLLTVNNLSDLTNAPAARANLGLGSAASQNSSVFDLAGTAAALLSSSNSWTGKQSFNTSATLAAGANLGIGNPAPVNPVDIGTKSTNSAQYLQISTNGNSSNFAGIKLSGNGYVSYIQMDYWGSYNTATGSAGHGVNFSSGRGTIAADNYWFRNASNNVVFAIVDSAYSSSSLGPLATTHNMLLGGSLTAATINTNVRSTASSDTAKTSDHTLLLNGSGVTESLPASPGTGQEIYLVNTASSNATISGNGKSIWTAGTSTASITLAADTTAILQFDGTLWRQIK